jgi:hypothetical protein
MISSSIHTKSGASSMKSAVSKLSISRLFARKPSPDAAQKKPSKQERLRKEKAARAEATYAYLSMR